MVVRHSGHKYWPFTPIFAQIWIYGSVPRQASRILSRLPWVSHLMGTQILHRVILGLWWADIARFHIQWISTAMSIWLDLVSHVERAFFYKFEFLVNLEGTRGYPRVPLAGTLEGTLEGYPRNPIPVIHLLPLTWNISKISHIPDIPTILYPIYLLYSTRYTRHSILIIPSKIYPKYPSRYTRYTPLRIPNIHPRLYPIYLRMYMPTEIILDYIIAGILGIIKGVYRV